MFIKCCLKGQRIDAREITAWEIEIVLSDLIVLSHLDSSHARVEPPPRECLALDAVDPMLPTHPVSQLEVGGHLTPTPWNGSRMGTTSMNGTNKGPLS